MKNDREEFLKGLVVLAEVCNQALSEDTLALYDHSLRGLGYPALCGALNQVLQNRRSRDPFPSLKEIRDIIQPPNDAESSSEEAVNRIIEAISRIGRYSPIEAQEFIGELGWLVVMRNGGWENTCDITIPQIPVVRKQWATLARTLYKRAELGQLGQAPALPRSAPEAIQSLTAGIGKLLPSDVEESEGCH